MEYISLKARIASILLLIAALSAFLWLLFDPFMGEHFRLKDEKVLIQNLRGDETLAKGDPLLEAKLRSNRLLFLNLPEQKQLKIQDKELLLDERIGRSSYKKLIGGILSFLFETPFVLLLWLASALIIPFFTLKGRQWTHNASILPLLFMCVYLSGTIYTSKPLVSIYPSEKEIIDHHLKRPLGTTLEEQAKDLKEGWELYLIENWAKEIPTKENYDRQVEKGAFLFNYALFEMPKQQNNSLAFAILGLIVSLVFAVATFRSSPVLESGKKQHIDPV